MWKDIGYGIFECENCHRRIEANKLPYLCECERKPIFSQRLKELRKRKGLTQKDLAKQVEVGVNLISWYESGKVQPTLDPLWKIAHHFGVSIDYLVGRTDFKEVNR